MASLKAQIRLTIVLGFVVILSGVFAMLALQDIYHHEADVTLEWNVVRLASLIFIIFIPLALASLWRALKLIP